MKTALLDLNILTALLWPAHEHHAAAHAWFGGRAGAGWATCPVTQLGFVRLVTNPAFSRDALSPTDAVALMAQNVAHANHEFWSEDLQVAAAIGSLGAKLQGYRQLTDAYLLALAKHHRGVLATFDRGMRTLAAGDFDSACEIVAVR